MGTGQSFTYLIRVENLGPHTANSVVVTLPLPANVQFGQWAGVGWSCSGAGGNVTCTRADLGVGVAPPLSIVVTAPTSVGLLSTTVQVRATTEDPALVNNSAAEATSVTAIADLALKYCQHARSGGHRRQPHLFPGQPIWATARLQILLSQPPCRSQ
ncbi:MAG: hypothetical protein IPK16_30910 [Anaerolineales bacterium]|nr:hypothetical protein [Anaerolineales bacterium]